MTQAINDPQGGLPAWSRQTAGRSGKSYQQYVNDPAFDPWTNLDSYLGPGGSQSQAAQQAFGYTNQQARGMGYADGSALPPDLKRQLFLANLERTRQQFADTGQDWGGDAASKLQSQGWAYTPGWGLAHGGQSYELQGQGTQPGQATGGGGARTTTPPPPAHDAWMNQPPPAGQTGGPAVPAPALDPGIPGGNATPGSAVNGGYDLALQTDPTRRMAALFQALSIGSPSQQHSWAGSNLMNIGQSLFDPWSKTQGLGGTTPTTQDMIAQFAKYMASGGGGAGSIRSDAANALQLAGGGGGPFAGMNDQELAPLLQNFSGLAHTGQNPLVQKGYAGLADDAIGQYANTLNQADQTGGNSADLRLLAFLANNPTYKFLTGR